MISVKNLTTTFGNIKALDGIDLEIGKGEFYGLVGPNGAGKTTLINVLSSLINPDSGEISVNAYNIKKDPLKCKKSIGVVSQEVALYQELSAYDNLIFWGGLYGLPSDFLKERVNYLISMFGLHDRRKDKIKAYSGGMKRRVNLASALIHSPQILFMDEPTVGIDPQSRNLIYEVLNDLHNSGITIVYTSHYLDEAEKLCDRIGIIDHGKIIKEGTLSELKRSISDIESIIITIADPDEEKKTMIEEYFGAESILSSDQLIFRTNDSTKELPGIIQECNKLGIKLLNIEIKLIDLETVFLSLTGRQLRD